jgi:DNA-binding Xre family transcriptional regulator
MEQADVSALRRREVIEIQDTLKHFMAARKLTLKDLADKLEVSIATAKRLLNGDDLSFERVLQICDWLGIRFHELVEIATQRRTDYHLCTVEQEDFLAENQAHFAFLRALQKGENIERIRAKYNLSVSDCGAYLSDLEVHGFVKLLPSDGFTVLVKDGMNWRQGGPLWRKLFGQWMRELTTHVSNRAGVDEQCIIDISQRKLSKKAFEELRQELDQISRKYASVSRLERELHPSHKLEYCSCVFFADMWTAPMWDVKPYGSRSSV